MSASPDPDPRVIEVLPAAVRVDEGESRAGREAPRATVYTGEVGDLRPGDPRTQWALARYLVARTVGDNAVRAVLGVALVLAALTVLLVAVSAPVALSVLVGLVAVGWFVAWRLARALWSRLAGGPALVPVRHELDALVRETRPDVRRELRRLGLPAHPLASFAFARRLVGRRRAETMTTLRGFDVDRVVPAERADRAVVLLERLQVARPV
jgi:hypothetical protein